MSVKHFFPDSQARTGTHPGLGASGQCMPARQRHRVTTWCCIERSARAAAAAEAEAADAEAIRQIRQWTAELVRFSKEPGAWPRLERQPLSW